MNWTEKRGAIEEKGCLFALGKRYWTQGDNSLKKTEEALFR